VQQRVVSVLPAHVDAYMLSMLCAGLQEVSLLADLRAVVARALSGLDMFSDADGKLSPTVSGSIGGAGKKQCMWTPLSQHSLESELNPWQK
jgi:hypothetical protein